MPLQDTELLQQASQFIKEKRYEEAASILERIPENPTAQTWLKKIYASLESHYNRELEIQTPVYSNSGDDRFLHQKIEQQTQVLYMQMEYFKAINDKFEDTRIQIRRIRFVTDMIGCLIILSLLPVILYFAIAFLVGVLLVGSQ
ncbi:MAG: hypothetical protein BroJett018_03810 [Chloroflexota bacterium]|nr:hypothetical protein [Chloroflexota bacterium]NOG61824.1 hypothetical protein [Chloroflexota bacterium]GIK62587.1 MAG: hypothetical protein BroJett018_03810 [Chloroflexota bacterium]